MTLERGNDTAFPLSQVLLLMAVWLEHLHVAHECDCDGWEQRSFLVEAANKFRAEIETSKGEREYRLTFQRRRGGDQHRIFYQTETAARRAYDALRNQPVYILRLHSRAVGPWEESENSGT